VSKRVFLSSPLSTLAEQNLNAALADLVRSNGHHCYVPQEHLPPGGGASALEIFEHNVAEVCKSDLVLTVLDKPGSGVVFEMAYAYALNKPILAFRSDQQGYLGKVLEGFWAALPVAQRATTLAELRSLLANL
jgi:nucleoside 2-deoxyribosyltransferase